MFHRKEDNNFFKSKNDLIPLLVHIPPVALQGLSLPFGLPLEPFLIVLSLSFCTSHAGSPLCGVSFVPQNPDKFCKLV